MEWKLERIVEAILYSAGRPVEASRIYRVLKRFLSVEPEDVRTAILRLSAEYRERSSALEVVCLPGDRYVLQLKPEYSDVARLFSFTPPIGRGLLKTLSYIAFNQPVALKEVAEARGRTVYRHVKELRRRRLISVSRRGRDTILCTSREFNEFLGLHGSPTEVSSTLRKLFSSKSKKLQTSL